MPRTRNSVLISQENLIEPIQEVKKSRGRPRKRKSSDESSEDSSPSKTRSDSLSRCLTTQLSITTNKSTSKFTSARQALADNSNFRLPGREALFDELTLFLDDHIVRKTSSSLYINGPPGKRLI
jgi:hypothetical protein